MNTEYFSVRQIAEKLNVSDFTVHKWIQDRILPHFKLNGVIRIKAKDLENFEDKHYIRASRRAPF